MADWTTIADIRREYGELDLDESSVPSCPLVQFKQWFEDVLSVEKSDPTAMVLSTVDEKGHPDSRVVLLKGLDEGHFIFYTNYESTKARQLNQTPYAAINFYWPEMSRQVRIKGAVEKVSDTQSDNYFASRPVKSQLSAIASPQSQKIAERRILEDRLNQLIADHGQKPVLRPKNWGGYQVIPEQIEFWQGRDNRLHDRIVYLKNKEKWIISRLAP